MSKGGRGRQEDLSDTCVAVAGSETSLIHPPSTERRQCRQPMHEKKWKEEWRESIKKQAIKTITILKF